MGPLYVARVRRQTVTLMDLAAFSASLSAAEPPRTLSDALRALWLDAQGDWDGAHEAAQADEGGDGDWVHAYLHRKEGDGGNAPMVSPCAEARLPNFIGRRVG